jgi:hypothetical protein
LEKYRKNDLNKKMIKYLNLSFCASMKNVRINNNKTPKSSFSRELKNGRIKKNHTGQATKKIFNI